MANDHGGGSVLRVSATEIIQELPKLSPAERRTERRVLSDLAVTEENLQFRSQVATEAAMMPHSFDATFASDSPSWR